MSRSASAAEALSKGWRLQQAGDFVRAEQTYSESLKLDETCAELWHLLGSVRRSLRKLAEAEQCFRRAIALKLDYGEARNFLAVTLAELGRFEEAIAEFHRAIALKPRDCELRYNLGIALKKHGRPAEAVAAWKIVCELKPDHAGARSALEQAGAAPTTSRRAADGNSAAAADGTSGELAKVLSDAWRAHTAGNFKAAESAYLLALRKDAAQADVWYLLGAVRHVTRRLDEAIADFRRALEIKPDYADAHNFLAVALAAQGEYVNAAAEFRQAIVLRPQDADLLVNLGLVLRLSRQHEDALEAFRAALRMKPEHGKAQTMLRRTLRSLDRAGDLVEEYRRIVAARGGSPAALHMLGLALIEAKRHDEAADTFRRALECDPGSARLLNNFGLALAGAQRHDEAVAAYQRALCEKPDFVEAHNNLAVALAKQHRVDEAVAHYEQALRIRPDFAQAMANLGGVLGNRGDLAAAERHQRRAIEIRPNFPEAHCNLAAVLMQSGRLDEAEAALRHALDIKPNFLEAIGNLGGVFAGRGDLAAAEESYNRALTIDPEFPGARYNRSLVWLSQGKLAEGFRDYEFRFRCDDFKPRRDRGPRWDGSPLAGRTLLVHAEQGLGDTIQFCRYLSLIAALGAPVLFECQKPLVRLIRRLKGLADDAIVFVAQGQPLPPYDVQAALISLPHAFGATLDSLPRDVPYLSADEKLVEQWRRELGDDRRLKIGIAWQGNPKYRNDARRSVPLEYFEPLTRLDGARLFSLQKNHGREQLAAARFAQHVTDLAPRLDERTAPFQDTAAVMCNLNLVVTSDTAVAHLAGALGVPVWVALPFAPDWRWLLDREDSPWYPTMRLFRQRREGDWSDVFERIAAAARQLADERASRYTMRGPK